MKFRNPTNGHVEVVTAAWLWTLLFGGLYFIVRGLWAPLIVWILLEVGIYLAIGTSATALFLIINIIFAAMAGGMVRNAYLRKGWIEVVNIIHDGAPRAPLQGAAMADVPVRKCPFCAEEIRPEAIKCKHCGSEVPSLEAAA